MKLTTLTSGLRSPAPACWTQSAPADDLRVLRVEALDSTSPDRQRTLQQEMFEIEPNAVAQFHGNERILEDARALAAELSAVPGSLSRLVKADHRTVCLPHIDDAV